MSVRARVSAYVRVSVCVYLVCVIKLFVPDQIARTNARYMHNARCTRHIQCMAADPNALMFFLRVSELNALTAIHRVSELNALITFCKVSELNALTAIHGVPELNALLTFCSILSFQQLMA